MCLNGKRSDRKKRNENYQLEKPYISKIVKEEVHTNILNDNK